MPGVPQGGPAGGPAQGPAGVQGRGGQAQAPPGAPAGAAAATPAGAPATPAGAPANPAGTPANPAGAQAAAAAQPPQGGRGGRQGGPAGPADRVNWDAPYIISPHNPRRLYWASNYVYRTDDRGDSWTRISPDLSRSLDAFNIPIMGKVWPRDSVALNTSTTPLSNVVSIDESPLLEGLLYAGTDDGLLQITDDGGKNWRKVEDFPGVPKWTYVTDVFASPRDVDTVFVTLNNWQRGDYKPYVVKSTDRGRTWTNITAQPARQARRVDHRAGSRQRQPAVRRHRVRAVRQRRRRQAVDAAERRHAADPGARHGDPEARERSRARRRSAAGSTSSTTTARCARSRRRRWPKSARLFPLRDAYLFNPLGLSPAGSAGLSPLSGLWAAPNPPFGAVFTYNVKEALPGDATLVLTITDDTGRQIRRMDVDKTAGLRRVAWNLRGEAAAGAAPAAAAAAAAEAGGRRPRRSTAGRAGRARHVPRHARARRSARTSRRSAQRRRSGSCRYRSRMLTARIAGSAGIAARRAAASDRAVIRV